METSRPSPRANQNIKLICKPELYLTTDMGLLEQNLYVYYYILVIAASIILVLCLRFWVVPHLYYNNPNKYHMTTPCLVDETAIPSYLVQS